MDICTEQLNILSSALRDIVMTKGCPQWVEEKIRKAMAAAKAYRPKEEEQIEEYVYHPIEVGNLVKNNSKDDGCVYQVLEEADPVQGVRLFNVRIMKSTSKNDPVGYIAHNVPETMLVFYREK